jgi:hypothetical protein
MELNTFINCYKPVKRGSVNEEVIQKYEHDFPSNYITLWKEYGFGKYNRGLIEICHPDDFKETLATWLGKKVDTYFPVAISGFGCLFYYRKLAGMEEDVCLLDPHYRKIDVCTWNLEDFFNIYLCDREIINNVLRKNLFLKSLDKFGLLKENEIFYFEPALAAGGAEKIAYVRKGNSQVHLHLLFHLTPSLI